ncbi:unnamed protein product [Mortierella alpina]
MASPTSATAPVPTNTITITNLHSCHFEEASLQALRAQADSFGQVCFFSPIKSFKRIFVVYHTTEDSIKAKSLHGTRFQGTTLRVYFGQHTELSIDPERYYLHLPENAKSCSEQTGLVSPPGSPPLGHVEDEEMPTIDDDFSLEAATTASPTLALTVEAPVSESAPAAATVDAAAPAQNLQHQIRKLRIDTHLRPSSISTLKTSPRSPVSPSSSLYPTTPTLLAFSPAIESQGEQPFITIQDWGMEEEAVEPVVQHTPVAHTPTFAAFTRCY